jgi:hypothetical protein
MPKSSVAMFSVSGFSLKHTECVMSRIILAGAAAAMAIIAALWWTGGLKAVACGVLTALVTAGVIAYAFVPITSGGLELAAGDVVAGLPGGTLIPIGVSAIPAAAWWVVSRVHHRNTPFGTGYAAIYCCLVGCCSAASGIVFAGVCFPRHARWVLQRASDLLPADA